jgi:Zn-dependent protease with chaperone function
MKMRLLPLVHILILAITPAIAQDSTTPFQKEVGLGLNFRNSVLVSRNEVVEGPEVDTGREVFQRLLKTSIVETGDPFPYRLTVLAGNEINASSYAGGQIFAEGGIARLMKRSPGMWAAVLGHEIAHTRQHHQFRGYLRQQALAEQIAFYDRRLAAGDNSAAWALLALKVGGGLANLKLSRDEEHEADRLGLMMMAEAGYHPDFAISGFRRIAGKSGDQSKIAAFFASHPRWETREQRQLQAYAEAMKIFESKWTDIDKSPGGRPPIMATIIGASAEKDKEGMKAIIRGTVNFRNAQNRTIFVVVKFFHNGRAVDASPDGRESYSLNDKELESGFRATPKSANETTWIEIQVPTSAIGSRERKLKAKLGVYSADGELLDSSKEFTVSFPN